MRTTQGLFDKPRKPSAGSERAAIHVREIAAILNLSPPLEGEGDSTGFIEARAFDFLQCSVPV